LKSKSRSMIRRFWAQQPVQGQASRALLLCLLKSIFVSHKADSKQIQKIKN